MRIMAPTKQTLLSKINYLQSELDALKDYFYVPDTYQFLVAKLDAQQVLLKTLEVEEQFSAIDSGAAESVPS